MSTVMTATDAPASQTPHHRRSREEMEALAKNFVATPVDAAPAKSSKAMLMAGIGGAVVLAGVVGFFALRSGGEEVRQDSAAAARAAAEVEEIQQRLEAERERTRKELEAGKEYLERIGAADAALVEDLSDRADRLAARQATATATAAAATAAPAPSADAPTPREDTRVATAAPTPKVVTPLQPAKVQPAPVQQAPAQQAPVQQAAVAKPEPAKAEPVKTEPAKTKPTTVAEAPRCEIHVSELSKSGTLTYESLKKMKGVRIDDFTGNVFTPPVMTGAGRKVVFEVLPTGCVRVAKR
jgi:uncharacterized membrane-anchored protein YhcB (DUF1043 family)